MKVIIDLFTRSFYEDLTVEKSAMNQNEMRLQLKLCQCDFVYERCEISYIYIYVSYKKVVSNATILLSQYRQALVYFCRQNNLLNREMSSRSPCLFGVAN